jgi:hypothetical protein
MSANGAKRRVADRYELEAELGAGGMGVVWRARDLLLGRAVAVKEVDLPPAVDAERLEALRARVWREARAAARLNHPGAVTVFDIVSDAGHDLIVMELVEAPTLDDLVREAGPLDPAAAAALGLRLLATLEAAHRAGIVHRDLKPKNVMVAEGGATKLADFGVAWLQGDPRLTATGLVVGSPAYMAPEQVEGGEVTPATDLWALGATLWFAVEGEAPFGGGEFQTLTAIVHGTPRTPRRLGPLAPVLAGLLAKDPAARPAAADLRPRLEAVAEGGGVPVPVPVPVGAAAGSPGDATPRPLAGGDPTDTRVLGQRALPPPSHERTGRRRGGLPPVPLPAGPAPGAARARPRRRGRGVAVLLVAGLVGVGAWLLASPDQPGQRPAQRRAAAPPPPRTSVPPGWRSWTGPGAAYRLAYPPGWRRTPKRDYVDFVSPGRDRFFRVQPTSEGLAPLPAQLGLERDFVGRHTGDGYRRIRLGPTRFKDRDAAEWEFTFASHGRPRHGYDITFLAGGLRHAILFQTDAGDWARTQGELRAFLAGFRPAA